MMLPWELKLTFALIHSLVGFHMTSYISVGCVVKRPVQLISYHFLTPVQHASCISIIEVLKPLRFTESVKPKNFHEIFIQFSVNFVNINCVNNKETAI